MKDSILRGELAIFLSLALVFAPGCGRMVSFQKRSTGSETLQYDVDTRFMFKHVVVMSNTYLSREVRELPASQFSDVQGGGLNCWRFETGDGRMFSAKDWDIDGYVDDSLILRRDLFARLPNDETAPRAKKAAIERIVSLSPMPIQAGKDIIMAERMARQGPTIQVLDVYGREHLLADGEGGVVDVKPVPYERVYGFDGNGLGVRMDASNITEFLQHGATSANAYGYATIRLSDVERWEFEKEWPPTVILFTLGVLLPFGLLALGAQSGEPSRCSGDHAPPVTSEAPKS